MKTFKIEKCTAKKVLLLFGLGITESGLLLAISLLAVLLLVTAFTFWSLLVGLTLVIGSFLGLSYFQQKQLFKQFFDQGLPFELVNDWNSDLDLISDLNLDLPLLKPQNKAE